MPIKIETAPRLGDGVAAHDVLAEWFVRAAQASVVSPRKDGIPYRRIEIPDEEFLALENHLNGELCPSDADGIIRDKIVAAIKAESEA